jgi:hypothetical protein
MGPFTDHPHTIEMVARLLDEELARKAAQRASLGFVPSASERPRLRSLVARLRARRAPFQPATEPAEDCPPATVGA